MQSRYQQKYRDRRNQIQIPERWSKCNYTFDNTHNKFESFRVRPTSKMTSLLPNFMPFGGLEVLYEKTFCAKFQIPS